MDLMNLAGQPWLDGLVVALVSTLIISGVMQDAAAHAGQAPSFGDPPLRERARTFVVAFPLGLLLGIACLVGIYYCR